MNLTADDAAEGIFKDRAKIGASLADIDPMTIDRSVSATALCLSRYHYCILTVVFPAQVSFDGVGGLNTHIRSLKEMIVFPLLYTEVFNKFRIQPPRGVLFHGPPGKLREKQLIVTLISTCWIRFN